MKLTRFLSNLLSPPHCVFCGEPIDFRMPENVCAACEHQLPYNNAKRCEICGCGLDIAYGKLCCRSCKNERPYFLKSISRYIYKDKVADSIRHMKFGSEQIWIAKTLGLLLAQTLREEYGDIEFHAVTYVPISKARIRERGFNQSQVLAQAICKQLGYKKPVALLKKPKDIPRQSSLKLRERKTNVIGAFSPANAHLAVDKTILLIDDVQTTGATLNECAKVLRKAGAAAVYCAVVASVQI